MNFDSYTTDGFFDELFEADNSVRANMRPLIDHINELPDPDLARHQKAAEAALLQMGITFSVYGDKRGTEKIFPFDIIPRVIDAPEWQRLDAGLKQRIRALNLFIEDLYNDQKILKDRVVSQELIKTATTYLKPCEGFTPPKGVWIHITGTDLVRDNNGEFMVLEDNLRCPSGVSYVLENRAVLKRTFPSIFRSMRVSPVNDYPDRLFETLRSVAPPDIENPTVVLLTPGVFNSAYFEHSYLARQMGIQLVEGRDLVVHDGFVKMRTTKGFERVDVIYRRIDDDFIDPKTFRKDSVLGVPGLMDVYRSGKVALANAPGTGIADDKAVYAYSPKIIKYYLGEDPIVPIVPTYLCSNPDERSHVLENLDSLVVKAVNLSGGYGMLIGPHSTKAEQDGFAQKIKANPRDFIAQPTVSLSRAPVIAGKNIEGRHVDLRPYVLFGEGIYVVPGGLTRVALTKGSLVVNSSQGGGSKDTWVLKARGSDA